MWKRRNLEKHDERKSAFVSRCSLPRAIKGNLSYFNCGTGSEWLFQISIFSRVLYAVKMNKKFGMFGMERDRWLWVNNRRVDIFVAELFQFSALLSQLELGWFQNKTPFKMLTKFTEILWQKGSVPDFFRCAFWGFIGSFHWFIFARFLFSLFSPKDRQRLGIIPLQFRRMKWT